MTTHQRVVAVVNAKAVKGFPYLQAVVYELKPRKDGVLTYRRVDMNYAWPRRSERLAVTDAQELAAKLGIPFWRHVRQNMTAEAANNPEGSD